MSEFGRRWGKNHIRPRGSERYGETPTMKNVADSSDNNPVSGDERVATAIVAREEKKIADMTFGQFYLVVTRGNFDPEVLTQLTTLWDNDDEQSIRNMRMNSY